MGKLHGDGARLHLMTLVPPKVLSSMSASRSTVITHRKVN